MMHGHTYIKYVTISRILRLSLSLIRYGFKETISDSGSRDAAHCDVLKRTELL